MAYEFSQKIMESFKSSELEKEFTVNGVTFTFRAQNNRDEAILAERIASVTTGNEDPFVAIDDVRVRSIASVLYKIDGQEIPDYLEDEEGNKVERIVVLLAEITKWPASLVTVLYEVSSDFRHRVRKTIRKSVQYDWFGVDLIKKDEEEEEKELLRMQQEELDKRGLAKLDDQGKEEPSPKSEED